MKCAYHPDVETNLRCGKCGKPICPKDLVQTPVGARCPDCARLYKLPTFQVPAKYYLRATVAGIGIAIVCGIVWAAIGGLTRFLYINLLLAAGTGYVIGELISRSVNRKRSKGLATIAGVAVVISYLGKLWFVSLLFGIPFQWALHFTPVNIVLDLVALGLGIFIAVNRLR